ncbi:Basic leucine zipper 61 [Raphanus sativus]|uniref:Basic leucine zipper 61 n=1 Tax=Raphanus sativus TaxID=3726 RepID=A0A6J0N040_RAPSA|nr:basic leucine zipper 61 [Raphanus sativus]XP_018477359.1 basic leucine zipper 61 [Raphanus sativus]KAJ4904913.1 Basic leucine zipper 61 [Raphanus sativus]
MAQLPPKVPTMTTTTTPHWPEFSSQKLPSIAATAAATAGQQNPSWMDEFLDFSSTRRGTDRRSISDSIAFLDQPSSGVGSHHFDRFDDEQFMSMFNDDLHQNHHHNNSVNGNVGHTRSSSNTSTPSDQNSLLSGEDNKEQPPSDNDHMDTTTANDNNVAGNNYNESDEVQSHCCKTEPQDGPSSTNQDSGKSSGNRIHDPKRVKRILANRQSAQRSRVRKLQYISELECSVTSLQTEVSVLSPRIAFLDHQRLLLNVDNSAIKQQIAALAQDKIFKDAHQEALKREIERLQQVYHQQSLKKMVDNISDQSLADIKPSVEKEQLLSA